MSLRLRLPLAICALCGLTMLAYSNSFESGFVMDNHFFVLEDSRVHQATPRNVRLIFEHTYWWPEGEAGLYRPITTLSYLFDYSILGHRDHPAGYHWFNLLIHIGNVLLVFALARRLGCEFWQAFLIAALWSLHPVLTESVTNIVGRSDLLAGISTLGGLLIYVRSMETAGRRRLAWLVGLMVLTAVGVFSKESGVTVAVIVALYELTWWNPARRRGFLLALAAMAPPILVMLWMRSRVLAASAPSVWPFVDNPIVGASFWVGHLTAVKVLARYLGLLAWPATLSVDYSYRQIPLVDGRPTDWLACIVIAALAVMVVLAYRRHKRFFFAAGFAFIALLPASNLIVPVGTIMAERFLYLPAVGFSICLILALYGMARRIGVTAKAPLALGLVICAGFAARTFARNRDWRDNFTLWSKAVETSPLSFKTHTGLSRQDPAKALDEDERSLAILDSLPDRLNDAVPYLRTAQDHIAKGDGLAQRDQAGRIVVPPESTAEYEKAKPLLLRALSIAEVHHTADKEKRHALWSPPGDPRLIRPFQEVGAWLMLSEVSLREARVADALTLARKAQTLGPATPEVYRQLRDVLAALGRPDDAMTALLEGEVLTESPELERTLVADYADYPGAARCAISYAKATPRIDFSCPGVRQRLCSAAADIIELSLKSGDPDLAARVKRELTATYGCGDSVGTQ